MKLNINLSDKRSITDAIDKLKSIKMGQDFDDAMVNKLVDICYDKCIENLDNNTKKYPNTQYRGIREAITKEYAKGGVGYIKIRPPATYVEFGTGVRGAGDSHPMSGEMNLSYRTEGWIYPTDEGASNPKKWQTKNGDWLGYTMGQPSIAFGYNAFLYTKEIAKNEIKINYKMAISK